jgi:hypothetical protein
MRRVANFGNNLTQSWLLEDLRKKAEISNQNQRLAIKLYQSQATYRASDFAQFSQNHSKQLKHL